MFFFQLGEEVGIGVLAIEGIGRRSCLWLQNDLAPVNLDVEPSAAPKPERLSYGLGDDQLAFG
jgi:hypothetical protein